MKAIKSFLGFALLMPLIALPSLGQDSKSPFHLFENRLREERAGFAGNKEALSTVFNSERIRLGEKFESELLIYLGNDVEKQSWISLFLIEPSYLHGNKPLPHLSLLIKEQALALLRGKKDEESLGNLTNLSVRSAVLSENLGLRVLAESHKKEVDKLLAANPTLTSWLPPLNDFDRCLYDSVGAEKPIPCKKNQATGGHTRLRCPISGGVLDHKALRKPVATYPDKARANRVSGEVTVPVLIDERGGVEDILPGVKGHPLLQEAAISAARQAGFPPTRLSGKPVKVCGILTYSFKP